MIEIGNKEEVLKRLNELRCSSEFRTICPFCGGSSENFVIGTNLVEIDHQRFFQYFCKRCGYSMLLNYNIVMDGVLNKKKKNYE